MCIVDADKWFAFQRLRRACIEGGHEDPLVTLNDERRQEAEQLRSRRKMKGEGQCR